MICSVFQNWIGGLADVGGRGNVLQTDCAALGLSLGAVKTKIHRARLKLEQVRQMRS